jgi:diaminopimelate epimerase
VVSVGNPHCIIQRNDYSLADIISIGEQLNRHPAFPEGVNVGFVKKCSRDEIELCVYERGAGVTEACGSGACAAVAVGRHHKDLDSTVTVRQAGGQVQVFWKTNDTPVQLRGTATRVFDGIWFD